MIKIEVRGLDEVQRMLSNMQRDLQSKVLQPALNKVAEKAKVELNRAIVAEFAVKPAEVRNAVEIRKARSGNLEALIEIFGSARKRGRSLNMIHFLAAAYLRGVGVFKTRSGAVGVRQRDIKAIGQQLGFQIKRGGGLKSKSGAFVGNRGRTVFIRAPGTTMNSRSKYGGTKHAEQIAPVQVIGFSQMFKSRRIERRVMDKVRADMPVEVGRALQMLQAKGIA